MKINFIKNLSWDHMNYNNNNEINDLDLEGQLFLIIKLLIFQ